MFWTTRCVTSARDPGVVASLLHFSAPTSPVCSTTASSVGPRSTPGPGASSTNRWSRRVQTGPGLSRFAGVRSTKLNKIFLQKK